jgi:RNA polymerase sigma factor (sigma-70 family)
MKTDFQDAWARKVDKVNNDVLYAWKGRFEAIGGDAEDAFQQILKRYVAKFHKGEVVEVDPDSIWSSEKHMLNAFRLGIKREYINLYNKVKKAKKTPETPETPKKPKTPKAVFVDFEEILKNQPDQSNLDPEQALSKEQEYEILRCAVRSLSPKMQDVVRLILEGFSFQETADELQIDIGAVYARWERTLEHFIEMSPEALMRSEASDHLKSENKNSSENGVVT